MAKGREGSDVIMLLPLNLPCYIGEIETWSFYAYTHTHTHTYAWRTRNKRVFGRLTFFGFSASKRRVLLLGGREADSEGGSEGLREVVREGGYYCYR